MLRIDAVFDMVEYTFRTNNDGSYLFVGVSTNNQIRSDSGYNSLHRIKAAIREYLRSNYALEQTAPVKDYPRITFGFTSPEFKP